MQAAVRIDQTGAGKASVRKALEFIEYIIEPAIQYLRVVVEQYDVVTFCLGAAPVAASNETEVFLVTDADQSGHSCEAFRRFIRRLIVHNDQFETGPASRFSQRAKTRGCIGPLVEYRYDDRDLRMIRNRQAIRWLGIAYFLQLLRFDKRRDEGLLMRRLGTHQRTTQPLCLECTHQLGKEQGPAHRVPGTRLREIMQHSPAHPERPGDPP